MRCGRVLVLPRFYEMTLLATDACQCHEVIDGQSLSSGLWIDSSHFELCVSEAVFEVIAQRFPPLREGLADHLGECLAIHL